MWLLKYAYAMFLKVRRRDNQPTRDPDGVCPLCGCAGGGRKGWSVPYGFIRERPAADWEYYIHPFPERGGR